LANTSFGAIIVTTTPTLIVGANSKRRGLIIDNNTVAPIALGPDDTITTTTGVRLKASAQWGLGIPDGWKGDVYGIAFSSTNDVRFWEWGE